MCALSGLSHDACFTHELLKEVAVFRLFPHSLNKQYHSHTVYKKNDLVWAVLILVAFKAFIFSQAHIYGVFFWGGVGCGFPLERVWCIH